MSRFNSRTLGGVRHNPSHSTETCTLVSIHAPREGCDLVSALHQAHEIPFQFTHPGRGATDTFAHRGNIDERFNSRTPGGVRPGYKSLGNIKPKFQFTHPGRGATCTALSCTCKSGLFQFTHPGRGATNRSRFFDRQGDGFNSRTPGGVRL